VRDCQGQGRVRARRTVSVDIPGGVETGLRLQLPGSGEVGPAGGPNGDLYLEVTVATHEVFSREGDDLLATLEVSMPDAILGTTRRSPRSTATSTSRCAPACSPATS
jgi:molecular chaperone DnaJ